MIQMISHCKYGMKRGVMSLYMAGSVDKKGFNMLINGLKLDKSFIFSGGEVQIRLPNLPHGLFEVTVETRLDSSDKMLELLLVAEALNHYYPSLSKSLVINYFPYARQDRRCYEREAFAKQVMMDLISSLGFDTIQVADIHSNTPPLSELFVEVTVLDIMKRNLNILDFVDVIVAPDKGSIEKVRKIAEYFEINLLIANKVRDPDTGNIVATEIIEGVEFLKPDANVLIIDDICDGGRTFIELAKVIRSTENMLNTVGLYVTHGIFSKGIDVLTDSGDIDHIITTDSICNINHNYLSVVPI